MSVNAYGMIFGVDSAMTSKSQHASQMAVAFVLAGLMLGGSSVLASEVPDAGSTLRQLQGLELGKSVPVMPSPSSGTRREPTVQSDQASGPKVRVTRFRFAGNKSLSDAALQKVVAPWTDGEFSFKELSLALDAVAETYRSSGRLARVYFPQQEVSDGEIRIDVLESVMGQLRFLDSTHRMDRDWFASYAQRHLPQQGQEVLTPEIERVVRVANEIPGLSVAGNLVAGQHEGETDLALSVEDRAIFSGLLMADNAGQKSSGSERVIAVLNSSGLSGQGDDWSLTLLKTRGVDYARVDVWLTDPWISGFKLGWLNSDMRYKIVSGDQVVNQPEGGAQSFGFQAAYAIERSQSAQLNWKLSWEHKSFYNQNASGPVSNYGLTVMNQQLAGFFADTWVQGAMNSYVLSLSAGQVGLAGSPNQQDDQKTARTEGRFSKWSYGFTRQQNLDDQWNLTTAFSGQWASQNLDSSEKFYIGGPTSVRAYPASEAGGSRGYQFNIDLHRPFDGDKTVGVFYDHGRVTVAAQPWDQSLNKLDLHGYGVSAQWQMLPKTRLKALASWRTGRNPNPTSTGMDQDGTLKSPRVWLEAAHSF